MKQTKINIILKRKLCGHENNFLSFSFVQIRIFSWECSLPTASVYAGLITGVTQIIIIPTGHKIAAKAHKQKVN